MITSSQAGVRVSALRSFAEIDSILDFWGACRGHRDARPDFYRLIVETYPDVLRPYVLVVQRGEHPVALLLGRLEERAVPAQLGYFQLPTPRLRLLNFLYGGRLGEASAEIDALFVASVAEALSAGEADAAFFHCLDERSDLYRAVRDRFTARRRERIRTSFVHRAATLPPGEQAFWQSLSSKERNNHRRRRRRLEQRFGEAISVSCIEREEEIEPFARDAEQIAAASYQRALSVGFRDAPAMRRRLALEARQGRLRGFLLRLDGKPAAFWITSFSDAVLYSDFLGYDPAYAAYGPGMFLVVEALNALCAKAAPGELRRLDFGMGEGEWKAILGDTVWAEANIYVFGRSWRAAITRTIRNAAVGAHYGAKTLLEATGVEHSLKRFWRRRLDASHRGGVGRPGLRDPDAE